MFQILKDLLPSCCIWQHYVNVVALFVYYLNRSLVRMCNEGNDDRSDEQGWRQVRDYCQRFGREHLLRPYLYDRANHGDFIRPTILTHKTDYATVGSASDLRTHKMERASLSDGRRSKSTEDIHSNADASVKGGSPDSGITSRKLEWDSLADIGYENVNLGESQNRNTFSTIERIVLDRNLKIDISSVSNRSDKSNSKQDLNFSSSPNAQSTPTSLSNPNSSKSTDKNVNVTTKNTIKNSGTREYKNFKSLTVNLKINKPEKVEGSVINVPKSPKSSAETANKHRNSDETTQTSNVRSENKEVQTSIKKTHKPVFIIKRKMPKVSIGKSQSIQLKEDDYDLDIETDTGVQNQSLDACESPDIQIQSPVEETLFKSDDNVLMSADSFEFVPGYAYKTSPSTEYENSKSDASSANYDRNVASSSSRFRDKETSMPSSIRRASDSSNELIDKLINRHCKRPELKAKILKLFKNVRSDLESVDVAKKAPIKIDEQCQTELQSQTTNSTDKKSVYSSAKSDKSQLKSVRNESSDSIKPRDKTEELDKSSSICIEFDKELDKINAEITSLLLKKVNLENKQNKIKISSSSSSSNSITITNDRNVSIPLLNLKSSSEESEVEKEISERRAKNAKNKETTLNTETYTKDDKLPSKEENSHCTCSSNNVCSFCILNLAESTSVSSNVSKTTSELVRFEKAYSTYKKCKVMKSFLKDYDGLVKRYRKMKAHKRGTDEYSKKSHGSVSSESLTGHSEPSQIEKLPDSKSSGAKSKTSESSAGTSKMSESQKISAGAETSKRSEIKTPAINKDNQMLLKEICDTLKGLDKKFNTMQRSPLVKMDHATQIPSSKSTARTFQTCSNKTSHKSDVKSIARSSVQSEIDTRLDYVDSDRKRCSCRSRRDAESNKNKSSIKCCCERTPPKMHPFEAMKNDRSRKPLAYDLVLEPSDSVMYESFQNRRKSLDLVVVKIPKLQPKNVRRALRTPESQNLDSTSGASTDEQLRELSSLNSAKSELSRGVGYEVPADNRDKILTVKEYLYQNRPRFVDNADKRRNFICEAQRLRNEKEEEIRKRLENGVANMSVTELQRLIKMRNRNCGLSRNKRLFNSQEIKKNTEKQYKKLPEILNKNEKLKKDTYRKTNKLMAQIFVKKLQQRTLKGVLNNPLCTNVLAL